MQRFVDVTKEEFNDYINNYPNNLYRSYLAGWMLYIDCGRFYGCKWPTGTVAMMSPLRINGAPIYRIGKEV